MRRSLIVQGQGGRKPTLYPSGGFSSVITPSRKRCLGGGLGLVAPRNDFCDSLDPRTSTITTRGLIIWFTYYSSASHSKPPKATLCAISRGLALCERRELPLDEEIDHSGPHGDSMRSALIVGIHIQAQRCTNGDGACLRNNPTQIPHDPSWGITANSNLIRCACGV